MKSTFPTLNMTFIIRSSFAVGHQIRQSPKTAWCNLSSPGPSLSDSDSDSIPINLCFKAKSCVQDSNLKPQPQARTQAFSKNLMFRMHILYPNYRCDLSSYLLQMQIIVLGCITNGLNYIFWRACSISMSVSRAEKSSTTEGHFNANVRWPLAVDSKICETWHSSMSGVWLCFDMLHCAILDWSSYGKVESKFYQHKR